MMRFARLTFAEFRSTLKLSAPFNVSSHVKYLDVQAGILLLQSYAGPRCFIPQRFLPEKYNYWRKVLPKQILLEAEGPADIETGHGSVECVICMNLVDVETPRARMVTPCNHLFHPGCLQRWMDVKMECPTCRAALPSP